MLVDVTQEEDGTFSAVALGRTPTLEVVGHESSGDAVEALWAMAQE